MKWLTPVKPEKNACPASALFQCSLIPSDAAAADENARRAAAAAGHKTTQLRRRPPVRRRTALYHISLSCDGHIYLLYSCFQWLLL